MGKFPFIRVIIILVFAFTFSACTPSIIDSIPPTNQPPPEEQEVSPANLVITSAGLEWPELHPPDPCLVQLPSPTINLCLQNQGGTSTSPEFAYFALPAAIAPAVQKSILQTLPGGSWTMPELITIEGLPGVEGSAEGIIIVNSSPPPDDSQPPPDDGAEGIIIINSMPGADGYTQGIIIINSMPGAEGNSEGIIIINSMPGDYKVSQVRAITMEDKPGEDGNTQEIVIVNNRPLPGGPLKPSELISVYGLPGADSSAEGIVIVNNTPPPDDGSPPPDDGAVGIIIVNSIPGVNSGAQGIVVVDTMPGPGTSAEGIIIVNSIPGKYNISQVMGIIIEDKPGDEGATEGIIIVNSSPPPDDSAEGIIIINSMPGADGDTQGIIIINSLPVNQGAAQPGLPFGFEIGEGMTAMMGEGSFGPGPYLLGKLELAKFGFPVELGPGEEFCIQITVSALAEETVGDPEMPLISDSFFDITFKLTIAIPQSNDSSSLVTQVSQIQAPPYPLCTQIPKPNYFSPTVTPTRPPTGPPTNTPYVRPSNTPRRPAPTPTPGFTPRP